MTKDQVPLIRYWPIAVFVIGVISTASVQAYQVDQLNTKVAGHSQLVNQVPRMKEDIQEIKGEVKDVRSAQIEMMKAVTRIEAKL